MTERLATQRGLIRLQSKAVSNEFKTIGNADSHSQKLSRKKLETVTAHSRAIRRTPLTNAPKKQLKEEPGKRPKPLQSQANRWSFSKHSDQAHEQLIIP